MFCFARFTALAALAGLLVTTTGCRSTEEVAGEEIVTTLDFDYAVGPEWKLVSMRGEAVDFEQPITMNLTAGGEVAGFAGVNRYFGSYKLIDQINIQFLQMGTTRMAGPPNLMELESEYLAALRDASAYHIETDRLKLLRADELLLEFSR